MTLEKAILPEAVKVSGSYYKIHTDYRMWLTFLRLINEKTKDITTFDIMYIYEKPDDRYAGFQALCEFANPPVKYPRIDESDKSKTDVIDYKGDGDYIYAAFLQQYGIDLIDVKELHWHKFKALLRGLTKTKLNDIINIRLYENDTGKATDYSRKMEKLRQAWEIDTLPDDENDPALQDFLSRIK